MREVLFHEISEDSSACLLKAKVTPSQRLNAQAHEAWVLVDKKKGLYLDWALHV